MEAKPWYKSKTYWYAIITLIVVWIPQVIDILTNYEAGRTSLVMAFVLTVNSLAVSVLRHFTSVPVTPMTEQNIAEVDEYVYANYTDEGVMNETNTDLL